MKLGDFQLNATHAVDRWFERSPLPIGYLRLCLEHNMFYYVDANRDRQYYLLYHAEKKKYYIMVASEDGDIITILTSAMFKETHGHISLSAAKSGLKEMLKELRIKWKDIRIDCNGVTVHKSSELVRKDPIWDRFELESNHQMIIKDSIHNPQSLASHIKLGAPVGELMSYELKIGDDVVATDYIKLKKSYVKNFATMVEDYILVNRPPANREVSRWQEKFKGKVKDPLSADVLRNAICKR